MKNVFISKDFDPKVFAINKVLEKSPYQVFVVVTFKKNGEVFKMMAFPTDYNVFGTLLNMVTARCLVFPKLISQLLNQMTNLVADENDTENELCRMALKCICCRIEASKVYIELPDQSIGFRLTFDIDNPRQSRLWGGTSEEIEDTYNEILKQF